MGAVLRAKTSVRLCTYCKVSFCHYLRSVTTAAIWETFVGFLLGAVLVDGFMMM